MYCIQCDLVDGWHERNMKTVDKGNILSILRTLRRILALFLAIYPIYWNLAGNAKRNDHCGNVASIWKSLVVEVAGVLPTLNCGGRGIEDGTLAIVAAVWCHESG